MSSQNKAAFVTGAASGLGAATAERLAADGYGLALVDRDAVGLAAVADRLAATGARIWSTTLDVSEQKEVAQAFADAVAFHGRIHAVANVAGIAVPAHLEDLTAEMFARTFAVNVTGTFNVCQVAAAHFAASGDGGRIVNISSVAAAYGNPNIIDYSASKGAVESMTRALARAVAPDNITVNAIAPGLIHTPMWDSSGTWLAENGSSPAGTTGRQVFDNTVAERVPLGRKQEPCDIAAAVAFLLSDQARNVTGQILNVDGGMVMR